MGLGSAVCVASFLEDFVRSRGYTWQFAAVSLVVVLQHLEDSERAAHLHS